jgi:predicted NodU family carbamoyl transferase
LHGIQNLALTLKLRSKPTFLSHDMSVQVYAYFTSGFERLF